ncbi:MAG: class I SAM-dependent methyltransferase [Actinobacteria bacterium]|nr:class I SAM-dependent methyltransferase [Actinomycetota bacterium]
MNREASRQWTADLYRRYFPRQPDAYTTFLHLAAAACPEGARIVDLGCGEEGYLSCLMEKAGEIIGLDGRPVRGPYSSYIQTDLSGCIPLEAQSIDLAASKFFLEHIEDPPGFLRHVHDVLRPGGQLVLMTPNIAYYPYTVNYILSLFLPQERRMRLVELFSGREAQDIFPVYYRCNTPRRLRRELEGAGFEVLHLRTYSDCEASAVFRPLGALAVAYERAISAMGLDWARGFIVVAARRD